ncbi:Serum paraoxonase/arylesterase 2 [Bulinus truncatus]|nr:Serum paraoxonase/arylesterase 2 [Bulinus truncatus]
MYRKIAIVSIILFALQHIIRIIYSLGYHLHFYQHYPGACNQINGIEYGAGDFSVTQDGLTFITSGWNMNLFSDNFQAYYKRNKITGAIYLIKIMENASTPLKLEIISYDTNFQIDSFRPRGITVWPNTTTGEHVIFVVNHPPKEVNRIEKFQFDPHNLVLHHIKSYTSDKLRLVYDIQALGEDSFYASNILYESRVRFFMMLELFALMPWSSVVYFKENTGFHEILTGLTSASGIIMSPCGMYVYVLLCMSSEVRVYTRHKDDSLLLHQVFPLYTHPDNAFVDPSTGDLFVSTHPIAHQFLNHLDRPDKIKAASQVLHLHTKDGSIVSVTELFYDDGDLISGSSSAGVYNKSLLVGSTIDKLIICQVNVPL